MIPWAWSTPFLDGRVFVGGRFDRLQWFFACFCIGEGSGCSWHYAVDIHFQDVLAEAGSDDGRFRFERDNACSLEWAEDDDLFGEAFVQRFDFCFRDFLITPRTTR